MKQWILGVVLMSATWIMAVEPNDPVFPVAKTNASFGMDLVGALLHNNASDNFVMSPISLQLALGMAISGSRGETFKTMESVTHFTDVPSGTLFRGLSQLQSVLRQTSPGIELNLANSMWIQHGFPIRPEFLNTTKGYFDAEIRTVDFKSAQTVSVLNQWVTQSTQGRITKLIEKLDPDAKIFLLNAVYFNGKWSRPFAQGQTQNRPFKGTFGIKSTPMMAQTGRYFYFKGANFQAVSIPFGNRRYSMLVFLPDKSTSLRTFYTLLNAKNWEAWMGQFRPRPGAVVLPKFSTSYTFQASDALKQMGMGIAFSYMANFAGINGGMGNEGLKLNSVVQKATLTVSEEGAQGAAGSAVEFGVTSIKEPEKPFSMVMERPFFYAIRDSQTGVLVLLGAYCNPES